MNLACQKWLGNFTKVLGIGVTPPPFGKNSQKIPVFFGSPPLAIISIIWSPIPHKQPTMGKQIRSVWPSCGSILRPPQVALVIPPRRPIRPDLMKPMPQASLVLRWDSRQLFHCFLFSLFCVLSSGANQSPTISLHFSALATVSTLSQSWIKHLNEWQVLHIHWVGTF